MARDRIRFLAALALVTPLGFATKCYAGPGSDWVSSQAGGLLYVIFWIFAALALFPRLSRLRVAGAVALATSALEFAQLWHPPCLERMRSTFLGHALLGETFDWSDFPYYAAGALAGYLAARALDAAGAKAGRSTNQRGEGDRPPEPPGDGTRR